MSHFFITDTIYLFQKGGETMTDSLISRRLKELRTLHNYTQDYVASALGIVRQTYSHYETGKRTPNSEILFKLAGLYNISIDDLMLLTIELDRNIYYDAPAPTQSSEDLAGFLEYFNNPNNQKNINSSTTSKKNCSIILKRFQTMIKKKSSNLQKSRLAKINS